MQTLNVMDNRDQLLGHLEAVQQLAEGPNLALLLGPNTKVSTGAD
jgi:hypothetical protein